MIIGVRRRRGLRGRASGQSLVELALALPVLLLILLVALDFGRVFYSWVVLQNASRIGADFAGLNAEAWEADPDTAATVAEYEALIEGDADRAPCDGPTSPPAPVFVDSTGDTSTTGQTPDTNYDVGDTVRVSLTCMFHPMTPFVSAIVGDDVQVGASSEFRIRSGDIAGLNNPVAIPRPSATSGSPTPTPTPAGTPTGTPTPAPTPTPTPTPTPCTVTIVRSPTDMNIDSGDPVTFSATTSTGCTIASYAWSFPLGTPATSTAAAPIVIFNTTSNTSVTVSLTAQTSTGPATDTEQFNLKKP